MTFRHVEMWCRLWFAIVALTIGLAAAWLLAVGVRAANGAEARPRTEAKQPAACPALASPRHPALDRLAQQHAEAMARRRHQDHSGFECRSREAMRATGLRSVSEICAESWTWQANDSTERLWAEMVRCWRQSPGHWRTASRRHAMIGAAMAKGRNGVWYAVIIAAD